MKRIIALLLVLCFVLVAFMACTGNNQETEAPTESGTAENNSHTLDITNEYRQKELVKTIKPEEHDYLGENLVMLIRNDEKIIREFGSDTSTEEINEQILTRNEQVHNDLNMVMIPEYIGSSDAGTCSKVYTERITQDVNSGMHTVDIAAHFAYFAGNVAVRERSANLLDEELFPYLDFTLPCWNQAVVKNSTINGISLVCAGDMTLSLFNFAYVMWHNKTLYSELRDEKDPVDMQDCVLGGEWTSDKLYKWSSIYRNTSSADDCDTYGVYIGKQNTVNIDVVPFCWNIDLMITNPEGTHAFNVVGNDKAEQAIVLYRKIMNGQGNGAAHKNCGGSCGFVEGNYVFANGVISWDASTAEKYRSMEDKYALLPWPKFDELQIGRELTDIEKELGVTDLGYYATTQDCYSLIGVLDHSESSVATKGEMVSAYLQHTAELSYADVRGYYFEKVIRGKNFGLDDTDGTVTKSITIFDMIIDNLQCEYWSLYSASMNDVMHLFRYTTVNSTDTLESSYKLKESIYVDALTKMDTWFGLIDDDSAE